MAFTEFSKPDKDINLRQLSGELGALSLPNFISLHMHLERRGTPPAGAVTPPYISVNSDALSDSQKTAITTAITNHTASG
jgi:hypothetical protein